MEELNARMTVAERWRTLTRQQKLAMGVFGVFGLVALIFSAVRVRQGIIRPFTTPVQQLVELKKRMGPSEEDIAERQKRTDTDGDGVSDWDELNKYRTSPYLKDSDSDGTPDNLEIAQGTDPNCPKGKTCVGAIGGTEAPEPRVPALLPPISASSGAYAASLARPPREPAAVRAWLQSLGFSPGELANYTNAQLLEAYDEAVKADTGKQTTSTND